MAIDECHELIANLGPRAMTVHDGLKNLPSEAFRSPPDTAAAYSGHEADFMKDQFSRYVEHQRGLGFVSIGQTDGGRWLSSQIADNRLYITRPEAEVLWIEASISFADRAAGKVFSLSLDSDPCRVFQKFELPRLLANDQVTHINGIPRDALLVMLANGGKETAVAEIERVTQQRCHDLLPALREWVEQQTVETQRPYETLNDLDHQHHIERIADRSLTPDRPRDLSQ